jgi:hypothetical protein
MICKVEKAERWPSRELTKRLDEILDAGGALLRLWPLVERERQQRDAAKEYGEPSVSDDLDSLIDLGLAWPSTTAATIDTVGRLWKADVQRRAAIITATWAASALVVPTSEWLRWCLDTGPARVGARRVGGTDVEALWSMCRAFTDADHLLGGGYARSTLVHYADQVVLPLLEGTYDDATGRALMSAAARVCNLIAFMAFDSGRQGLAQRNYIQALRLAQASGDRRPAEALELAGAGLRTARTCGSHASVARCQALTARAHARQGGLGSAAACASAMNKAETELDKIQHGDEPAWIRFFDAEQLSAEFMYASADLDHHKQVRRFAPAVLAGSKSMQRRRVLATTTLASTYLPHATRKVTGVDVDHACAVLSDAVPAVGALTSLRGLDAVNRVRRHLVPYAERPAVKDVETRLLATVGAAE